MKTTPHLIAPLLMNGPSSLSLNDATRETIAPKQETSR